MVRMLLLTSMITLVGQTAAFSVLYYGDIQQELAVLKYEAQSLKVLSLIEAHVRGNCVLLSSNQKAMLIQELDELKFNLCKQRAGRLLLPFVITAGIAMWCVLSFNDAVAKQDILLTDSSTISRNDSYEAWYATGRSFGWLLISTFIGFLIEAEHNGQMNACLAKERNIERKINNIITLLQQ